MEPRSRRLLWIPTLKSSRELGRRVYHSRIVHLVEPRPSGNTMDAKTLAYYFGYDAPGNLSIHDGLEALFRYKEYLRTHNPRTKKQLLRYNESDLKLTRRIFEDLRNLEAGRGDVPRYRLEA